MSKFKVELEGEGFRIKQDDGTTRARYSGARTAGAGMAVMIEEIDRLRSVLSLVRTQATVASMKDGNVTVIMPAHVYKELMGS